MSTKKFGIIGGILGLAGLGGYLASRKTSTTTLLPTTGKAPAGATAVPASSPFADYPKSMTVTTASTALAIRSSAAGTGTQIGNANKGTTITATGPSVAGDNTQNPEGWIPVQQGSVVGFASGKYLS